MIIAPRAWAGAVALAMLVPAAAAAQTPRNPFAELFGRTPERTGREFTSVLFRSNALAQMGVTVEQLGEVPAIIPDGLAAGASASIVLQHIRDRVQVAGQGRTSYQEFRTHPAFGTPAFDAGMRADFKATTRLSLYGSANVVRSPFYQSLFMTADQAGSMAPVDRAAILLMRNDTLAGTAGLTSRYTSRSSLELSAQFRETNFVSRPELGLKSVGGKALWRRQMTRDLAIRAGYGREDVTQHTAEGPQLFVRELLDLGVDYAKELTIARRTSLFFGTQTSIIRDEFGKRHFRLNGSVRLDKRFHRTWQVILLGRRGTDFMPGFRAPVLSDQVTLWMGGDLSKRLALDLDVNGGQGTVGFEDPRKFMSYSGRSKLTFAVTRHLGVFGQYGYYFYENPPTALTLFGPPRVARQAIAVGVQTSISIYNKDKVARDPR